MTATERAKPSPAKMALFDITERIQFIREEIFVFFDKRTIWIGVFVDRLKELLNDYDCYVEYAPLFGPVIPDLVERIGLFLDEILQEVRIDSANTLELVPTFYQKKVLALLGRLLLNLFGDSDSLGHEHVTLYCFSLLLTNLMRLILAFPVVSENTFRNVFSMERN